MRAVPGSAARAPRAFGLSARARPAYLARSPPRHRQRAPAASLCLRPLPASRALAGGHVTDGRRAGAGARAHFRRTELGLGLCCRRSSLARLSEASVASGREAVGRLDPVHTLCLSPPYSEGEAGEPCAVSARIQIPTANPAPSPTAKGGVR